MSLISFILSGPVVVAAKLFSLCLELFIVYNMVSLKIFTQKKHQNILFFSAILSGAIICDVRALLENIPILFDSAAPAVILIFFKRAVNLANIFYHLGISLLIENLLKHYVPVSRLYIFVRMLIGGALTLPYFWGMATSPMLFTSLELTSKQYIYAYALVISLHSFMHFFYAIFTKRGIPRILHHQLKILVFCFIGPQLTFKFFAFDLFSFNFYSPILKNALRVFNSLVMTSALYYCVYKLAGIRFLNTKRPVPRSNGFNFTNDFKKILIRLGHCTTTAEIKTITYKFFSDAFAIPEQKTRLFICDEDLSEQHDKHRYAAVATIMRALEETNLGSSLANIRTEKILVRDDAEFSAFYEEQFDDKQVSFLHEINADVFLPIFDKSVFIGFIIIEHDPDHNKLLTDRQQEEMILFAAYASSVINLLKNRNLDALLAYEKQLEEELYTKTREIEQYRESLRSFMKHSREQKIGIMFYRNGKFTSGNQTTQEFISHNPNTHMGHPISQALRQIAANVEKYKTAQTTITRMDNEKRLLISGIPSLENQSVIITLSYPEVSDIVKMQSDLLKNPSQWDYLLYLETTESGRLINQLIPGSGEVLLNFKLELLAAALNRRAILLSASPEDMLAIVELLHVIGLRKNLHCMHLTAPENNQNYGMELFGINNLLSTTKLAPSLCETLNKTGTLFIHNIQHLSMETQNHLLELLQYGTYRSLRSEQRVASDVRIIVSSTDDLQKLVTEGSFSLHLFNELKKGAVAVPAFDNLAQEEFNDLLAGLTRQLLRVKQAERVITLDEKEKTILYQEHTKSVQELRKKLYTHLMQKTSAQKLSGIFATSTLKEQLEPEIAEAVLLGKKALQDKRLLNFLWNKFRNQTKIASLLGVNRSSVNRRCREYDIFSSADYTTKKPYASSV